jgi:hypothetical protein
MTLSRVLLSTALAATFVLAACSKEPAQQATTTAPPPQTDTAIQPVKSGELPLPEFKPCGSTSHPMLPAKWEATSLMQDFVLNTLWFGKFVYDESAQAFRFSVADRYGIDFDMITTTDRKLYLLEGEGDMPTSCTLLTMASPFTVPSRDWLAQEAKCVGEAPILQRNQAWWKSPSGQGANWFWFDTSNSMPFRSMYYADAKPTTPVPIYEHFTFNYFPAFKGVPSTNLAQIVQMCQSRGGANATATAEFSRPSIEPLMKRKSKYPNTDAKTIARIQQWIPGISECSSTKALPPKWPDQLQITAFMTAVSFDPNPFPTRIYYDWTKKAQNTTLYYYPPTPKNYAQTAYLLGETGFITFVEEGGGVSGCQQVLPGPPVPNWKEVDGCECRAQIAPRTPLNPSDTPTKILWCKTDLQLKQVFWTWYSDTGRPIVFMQTNSSPTAGTGLNLADYHEWGPGSVAPAGTFDLPKACEGQKKQPGAFPTQCNDCHLPLNTKGGGATPAG